MSLVGPYAFSTTQECCLVTSETAGRLFVMYLGLGGLCLFVVFSVLVQVPMCSLSSLTTVNAIEGPPAQVPTMMRTAVFAFGAISVVSSQLGVLATTNDTFVNVTITYNTTTVNDTAGKRFSAVP
jgi:hypothetical protein